MAVEARYLVGDPIAAIKMRNAAGSVVDYSQQSLAGRALVLFLANGKESDADWTEFRNLADALTGMDALCAVVVPDVAAVPALSDAVEVLVDTNGESAAAFGIERPGMALVGRDSRLKAAIYGRSWMGILNAVRRSVGPTTPGVVSAQAPVLMIEDVLEPALRDRLIEYWRAGEKRSDVVSSTRQGSAARVANLKRRGDVIVEDQNLVALLRQRMARRVLGEIRKVHHMEIVGHEAFRVGCYDAVDQGFFGRHRDNATPYTAHRRYALTLNLNDDYAGGELKFPEYGNTLYRPSAGGAVIFSCALLHEALPVTDGRRFVLLSFFFDKEGARQEKESRERSRNGTGDI